MDSPDPTLNYQSPDAPPPNSRRPYAYLAAALAPFIAMPFAPLGREFAPATAVIIFGTLYSPINTALAALAAYRHRGQQGLFGTSLAAAVIAGINALLLLFAFIMIAIHGMPC